MTENITYKAGDKVVYRAKADQGQIWTIKKIDHRLKRCFIERRTPDRLFQKSAAFHLLILEVDLPRRTKVVAQLPHRPKSKAQEEKDNSLVQTFERIASILKLTQAHEEVTTLLIQKMLMPDLTIRTIQRHADALVREGYLECTRRGRGGTNIFKLTNQARAMMNMPIPGLQPVTEAF